MLKLEVFDPPMCCKSGICGSSADPLLVIFASNLEWLKAQGVEVLRYGLALEPAKFVKTDIVNQTIQKEGDKCLPIVLFDGKIAHKGNYPSREKLASICGVKYNDEESPPIHREENCCCGVDCDCNSIALPELDYPKRKCECSNAAAEDNCFCTAETELKEERKLLSYENFLYTIIFICLLAIIYLIFD